MWEFPSYGLLGCPSCGHIRTMPLGLLTTWAYSPLALWGPNTWAIQLLRRLDFSSFFLIHLSNHLSLLFYWISVSTELNALATFTTEATLVCQEASSHPAGPPSHGKGPLLSVIWEISLWCVTQSDWGCPGWKLSSPQHLPLFFSRILSTPPWNFLTSQEQQLLAPGSVTSPCPFVLGAVCSHSPRALLGPYISSFLACL